MSNERGVSLLEVLVSALIVGIVILGITLMLTRSYSFTVAEGTNQGELYLVEQKLEKLVVIGFSGVPVMGPTDTGHNAGCVSDTEPCYSETLSGGERVATSRLQNFVRLTCVDYVRDLPYPAACTPNTCTSAVADDDGVCRTKRAQITVRPCTPGDSLCAGLQSEAALAQPDTVAFDMILVQPRSPRP